MWDGACGRAPSPTDPVAGGGLLPPIVVRMTPHPAGGGYFWYRIPSAADAGAACPIRLLHPPHRCVQRCLFEGEWGLGSDCGVRPEQERRLQIVRVRYEVSSPHTAVFLPLSIFPVVPVLQGQPQEEKAGACQWGRSIRVLTAIHVWLGRVWYQWWSGAWGGPRGPRGRQSYPAARALPCCQRASRRARSHVAKLCLACLSARESTGLAPTGAASENQPRSGSERSVCRRGRTPVLRPPPRPSPIVCFGSNPIKALISTAFGWALEGL